MAEPKIVSGVKANPEDAKKDWYCQGCGGLLDKRLDQDPTHSIACGECGESWWATEPPTDEAVAQRAMERSAREEARARAAKVRGQAATK